MIEDQVPNILKSLPARISDILQPWAERTPNQPALIEDAGSWSYRQLALAVDEARVWLLNSGIRPGDRVMIVCENCRAFVAVLLALAGLDAWPVLVNARLSAREIDQIRDHCGARRLIYTTSVSPQATDHATRHGATIREMGSLGTIGIGSLNESAEPELIGASVPDRVAALIYTSGTTGVPKGVMLTHRSLLFIAAVSARIRSLTPADRLLGILPMSHAVGLSAVLLGTLMSGAMLYLSPRFDPVTTRKILEKYQLTVVLGSPALFILFLEYAKLKGLTSLNFPKLRIISSSGAPLHAATKAATESLFGMVLHNGYGVTECSPTIALTRIETPRSDTSVGRVFPGIEIKFVSPDRRSVAEGEVGELWVRGPNVMKGYYRSREETVAVIDEEGWFNTRDLARLEDGHLFIVGRTKELIVRSGFNVYPAEVEGVLNTHPEVARSAVLGRSTEGNEEVVAVIQLHPGSQLTKMALAEYASRHLASYKRPSQIIFVPDIPVTPTGKVAKDRLARIVQNMVVAT